MADTAPLPHAAPAAPAAGQAWRGWLATAGLVLVGFLLLGAAVVPWWLSEPSRVTAWVRRNVPNLHGTVEMGKATFTWTGPIVFEDVVVVPESGAREPVQITRVEVEHGIAAFLLSGGDCGRVRVEGLEAHLVFDDERHSNVTGLIYDPAIPDAAPPKESGLRMRLEVEDARVRIEGPWSDDPWISDPIDVKLRLAKAASGTGSEWTLEPTTILASAKLEPGVAQGVLAYAAPILADATRSSGRFSLALDGGTFPVGVPEKATFAGTLTMHEVDLGPGPMVARILASLPGDLQVPPAIRIADDSRIAFRMENRRMWHEGLEFGVPLPRGRRLDLVSKGWVGLDDQSLDLALALPFPEGMPAERPMLSALGGKTISLGVVGKLGEPRVDFDGSIRNVAADVAADVIGGVIDRLRARRGGASADATAAVPSETAPPAGPRPGWSRQRPAAPGVATTDTAPADDTVTDATADDAAGDSSSAAAEPLPPPPPRPGWSPTKPAGQAGPRPAPPARLAEDRADAKPIGGPPSGAARAKPGDVVDDGGATGTAPDSGEKPRAGAAQILDQVRDTLAPQTAGDPRADTVIDLVGGLIDEVAKRRAERAAASRAADEAAGGAENGAAATGRAADQAPPPEGPRRGRLLRRLLRPEPAGTP